jgi:hypothetical protein
MSTRRGGIPGPESRTGLVRPTMSEAEFERLAQAVAYSGTETDAEPAVEPPVEEPAPTPARATPTAPTNRSSRPRPRPAAKPRRVQRMFAIEEDLDKKLWLYAIHVGKDRSDVVNDLLRPVVASMVLYDSRDRRSAARTPVEPAGFEAAEGQGRGAEA